MSSLSPLNTQYPLSFKFIAELSSQSALFSEEICSLSVLLIWLRTSCKKWWCHHWGQISELHTSQLQHRWDKWGSVALASLRLTSEVCRAHRPHLSKPATILSRSEIILQQPHLNLSVSWFSWGLSFITTAAFLVNYLLDICHINTYWNDSANRAT